MKRPISDRQAALLVGGLAIGLFYGRLLSPELAIVARDLPFLHLPLRTAFVALADGGLPSWNPFIHGGQPILSNPHYAAFYPPSWLQLVLPLPYAVNLIILLHAAIGFAGCWRLVRLLGGGRGAAALAAVATVGGGTMLSLPSLLNLFCAVAWLPWVLAWGHEGLSSAEARGARFLAALAWCLQLLAGSPAAAIASGVALGALSLPAALREPARFGRLAIIGTLALLLGGIQWLPTLTRLGGTARGGGLAAEEATTWSASPLRLLELAAPHLYGDPARDEEELYFGWTLHDKGYPLILSIYPGLLLLVLAIAHVLAGRRRPLALLLMIAGGLFLALGRFNPLYALVAAAPPIGMVRYPEKFLLLVTLGLVVIGARGWHHLLADRLTTAHRARILTAAGVAAALASWWLLSWVLPGAISQIVARLVGERATPGQLANGIGFVRGEAMVMTLTAAAVLTLFWLARSPRLSERTLTALALLVLVADLWHAGRRLNPVGPASWYREPPPIATADSPNRLFSDAAFFSGPEIGLRLGPEGLSQMRAKLDRLDPYSGNLWGVAYALNADYDLLLTDWGRHAYRLLEEAWQRPELAGPLLSAWNVDRIATRRPPAELARELRATGLAPRVGQLVAHPPLPRFRFAPQARLGPSLAESLAAARASAYDLATRESVVHPTRSGEPAFAADARLLSVSDRASEIELRYESLSEALLVIASTYDLGWRAACDGRPVEVHPTAVGQMALILPAGSHTVELVYRDPTVGLGTAMTTLTLLLLGLTEVRRRKRLAAASE